MRFLTFTIISLSLIFCSVVKLRAQSPRKWCANYETKKAISIGGKILDKNLFLQDSQGKLITCSPSFSTQKIIPGANQTYVAPANDDCLNAQVVTPNGTCIPGTTVAALDNLTGTAGCQAGAPNSHEDVWYSFVATGSAFTATVTSAAPFSGNVEFLLLSGTCAGGFTILNSTCGASPLSVSQTGLLPGTTYYFVIANDATGTNGPFTVCPTTTNPPVNCTDNDDCLTPTTLTYTLGTQTCITDCNTGSAPGPDFLGTNCYDFTTPTVWYSITTNANSASLNINLASATMTNPYFTVFTTADCSNYTIINCTQGASGSATTTIPVSVNTTYLIAVSAQGGATGNFNLCYTLNSDNSSCNTGDVLTEVSSSDPTTPIGGPYTPGETVNFCYTINQFKKANCNWLMGIVPTFGNCWSPSSFNAQGKPVTSSGPTVAGSASGTWQWYPAGSVVYNNINGGYVPPNTPLPGGWFFQCNTCGISSLDPDNSWGDGDATGPPGTECDPNGNGYTWTVCFTLIAGPSSNCSNGNTNCGITMKTYADGEVGGWTDIGCTADLPFVWYASLYCCLPASANAGTNPTLNCINTSTILNGSSSSAGATYSWSGPGIVSGGTSASPTVNAPGIYTVTVNATGACANTDTVRVFQNTTQPTVSAGSAQTITCTTSTVTLSGSSTTSGVNYAWTGPSIVSGSSSSTATVNANGTYTLTVTNPVNGCTNTSTVAVGTNTTVPNVNAGTNQLLTCSATSVQLSGSSTTGGVNYSWQGPSSGTPAGSTPTASSTNVSSSGTYTLTVTNPTNGCSSSATVNVNPDSNLPDVNVGSSQILTCSTTSVTLSGSSTTSGVTYSWSGPGIVSGGSSSSAVVNASGIYTLTVNNPSNGCSSNGTVQVSLDNTVPTITINPAADLTCSSTQVPLTAITNITSPQISWTGPGIVSGGTSLSPTVNATGTYSVTITDPGNGCSTVSSITVNSNTTSPDLDAGSSVTLDCSATSVNLTGTSLTSGAVYLWSGPGIVSGGGTSSPTVNAVGMYTLTVTNPSNGCTGIDSVEVLQSTNLPNVVAGSAQFISCTTSTATVSAGSSTSGVSYSWSGPSSFTANGSSATVNQAGTYTVTVLDPLNSCTNTATVIVSDSTQLPTVSAGQDALLTCLNLNGTLTGSSTTSVVSYLWTGPSSFSSSSSTVSVSTPGQYTLTVTNVNTGCQSIDVVDVVQNILSPDLSIAPPGILNCTTTSISLSAVSSTSGISYQWTGPNGFNSSVSGPSVSDSGTYQLVITDPVNGCSSTQTVYVSENTQLPTGSISSAITNLDCITTSTNLFATTGSASTIVEWSGSGGVLSGNPITVTSAGTYTGTFTDVSNGCTSQQSITITIDTASPVIVVSATADSLGCAHPSADLNVQSNVTSTYLWTGPSSFTSTSQTPSGINVSGVYSVSVTNAVNGCVSQSSVTLVDVPNPVASFIADPSVGTAPLTVNFTNTSTPGFGSYVWSFGNGGGSVDVSPSSLYSDPGTYTVTLVGLGSSTACNDTVYAEITVYPEATIIVPNVFSPNGDNVNDAFSFITTGMRELEADIFDRWGLKVGRIVGVNGSWDGKDSSPGTYYFILTATTLEGKQITKNGFVLLVK